MLCNSPNVSLLGRNRPEVLSMAQGHRSYILLVKIHTSFVKQVLLVRWLAIVFLVLIAAKMQQYAVIITTVGMKKQSVAITIVYIICQ